MSPRPFCSALTLALLLTAPLASAADDLAPLRAVFDAHEQALDQHQLDALMALYAPGERTVVLGTTPAERWVGQAEIAEAYRHFFADFDAGTLSRDCPWMLAEVRGDLGFLSATCNYQDARNGVRRDYALNLSVVLEQLDGAWKLRTMHFSNPVAAD